MTKVIVYLRGTTANYGSISHQAEYVYEHVRHEKMRVVGDFRDVDAPDLQSRSALKNAIEEALMQSVLYIVVQSPKVLDDNLATAEALVVGLARQGIEVLWAQEGINHTKYRDDPLRELIRDAAQKSIGVQKLLLPIRLRTARRLKGVRPGPRPYGRWKWEKDTLKRIKQLRRKPRNQPRRSWRVIANKLNSEGSRSPKGRLWSPSNVRRLFGRDV